MVRGLSMLVVPLLILLASFPAEGQVKHCSSIAQNVLSGPAPQQAWLTVEIPPSATFESVSYWARPHVSTGTPPWQSCPINGGTCLTPVAAIFPKAQGEGGNGTDTPNTNTRNWSMMVRGPQQMFTGETYVRLVVNYTTNDKVCVSQQSFGSNANSSFQGSIVLPVGKSATFFRTFGAEIGPQFTWQSCGEAPNLVNFPQRCNMVGGVIGGLSFILTSQGNDAADNAIVVFTKCENHSGTLRRGCRTSIEYTP